MVDLLSQRIIPLADEHDRTRFTCGVEALDRYLRTHAGQDQRRRIAACYVLVDPEGHRVTGYYTLSAHTIVTENLPEELRKRLPRYGQIPCTLLGRLAIDGEYRGRGLGRHLLTDALNRALLHSRHVGAWAVVVDAIDDAAAQFYSRQGFTAFPTAPRRLFMAMRTIEVAFR